MRAEVEVVSGSGGGGGGKAGGGAARTPVELPNTLRSISTARSVHLVGEGEIRGLVNGLKSIYFDGTPLQDASGKYNFENVSVAWRYGLPDQDVLPGFSSVEAETAVNVKVTNATPVVRTASNTDNDAIRVTLRIPALWTANQTTGDVGPYSLALKIEVKNSGGAYVQKVAETIQGKTTSDYLKAWRIPLTPGTGPWDIRVSRVSADYDSIASAGDLFWSTFTEIIEHKFIYPDSAVFGVTCDARSFGGAFPTIAFEVYGIKMPVPSNYNPLTRAYTGSWDGTFTTAWTDNPAWVFWLLATNPRFGLGQYIDASQVDKWTLYQIAQYCDELVPDGKGGTEPRYTFNAVISDREEAYRVLLAIASVFQGFVYWSTGSVFATADMPSDPVKLVTNSNVVGGRFTYTGGSLKARHSAILVNWNDPDDGYRQNTEVVEDQDAIEEFNYRPDEKAAPGCTSRGQARRYGKWQLDTERYETETVTYSCFFDHADALPGQLIEVADENYAGAAIGGRILEATPDTVVLDRAIPIPDFDSSIDVVMPDGSVFTSAIANGEGTTDTLTLVTPFSTLPLAGAVFVVTTSAVSPRLFRILSIAENEDHLFEVTALLHSPGKYARVEQDLVVEEPDFTVLPSGTLDHPTNITNDQRLYDAGAGVISGAITFSWTPPADARVARYEVQVARNGLDYTRAGFSNETSFDLTGIQRSETSLGVRVRAMDDLGRSSDWVTSDSISLSMYSARPADVSNFRLAVLTEGVAKLTWDAVTSIGLDHYTVRFSPALVGATWGSAQIIDAGIVGSSATLPAQSGTYFVKGISKFGAESLNAAAIITDIPSLASFNAVETLEPAPTWTGTLVDVSVDAGELVLDDGETEGTATFAAIDLGDVFPSRVTAVVEAYGRNDSYFMSTWTSLSDVDSLSGADPAGWNVVVEERHTNDDPGGSPTWSDWAPLQIGTISARAYQARLKLYSLALPTKPVVSSLTVTVDMPDRSIADKDLVSGTAGGGYRVDFAVPFRGLKAVNITMSNGVTGDTVSFPAKDATGFNILFKDAGGTIRSRTFDYNAVGYGSVT